MSRKKESGRNLDERFFSSLYEPRVEPAKRGTATVPPNQNDFTFSEHTTNPYQTFPWRPTRTMRLCLKVFVLLFRTKQRAPHFLRSTETVAEGAGGTQKSARRVRRYDQGDEDQQMKNTLPGVVTVTFDEKDEMFENKMEGHE